MLFNDKQLQVLRYNNQYKPKLTICEGSVRSSKSRINLWMFLLHASQYKNKNFIITGATIPTIQKNVLDDIEEVFGCQIKLDKNNRFRFMSNKFNCFGTKDSDDHKTIKGFTAHGWLGNEITESHKSAVQQAMWRCSGKGARIFWDCNPDHPQHHVKIDYIDKADGQNIKAWHFILDDNSKTNNGFLEDEYIDFIKQTTPKGYMYDRNILGLWVANEGMIYNTFNPDKHFISHVPIIKEYFASIDWGFKHKGVLLLGGEDSQGINYILHEYSEFEKTIDYWINLCKDLNKKYGSIRYYCDSARPDLIQELRKKGINALEANKSVIDGIVYINQLFHTEQLFIVANNVTYFKDEIYNYIWKDNKIKEEPIKENDDVMDAMRYMFYSRHKSRRVATIRIDANDFGI